MLFMASATGLKKGVNHEKHYYRQRNTGYYIRG